MNSGAPLSLTSGPLSTTKRALSGLNLLICRNKVTSEVILLAPICRFFCAPLSHLSSVLSVSVSAAPVLVLVQWSCCLLVSRDEWTVVWFYIQHLFLPNVSCNILKEMRLCSAVGASCFHQFHQFSDWCQQCFSIGRGFHFFDISCLSVCVSVSWLGG